MAIANDFTKRFKYPLPLASMTWPSAADLAYSAWPERLYIIDENGRIAYRGGMDPLTTSPTKPAPGWPGVTAK